MAFNQFYFNKKAEREKKKEEEKKWITQYFRKVQGLIQHIFRVKKDQNDDPNLKDRIFVKEHQHDTAKSLKGTKISNPDVALDILEALRATLLKKKMALQEDRNEQEHNKSVTASYMDASNTSQGSQGNMTAASFMSATTVGTKQDNEGDFADQYCDF